MTALSRYIPAWLPSGDPKQMLKCQHPQLAVICSLGILAVGATRLHAETEKAVSPIWLDNSEGIELSQPVTSVAALDNPAAKLPPTTTPVVALEPSSEGLSQPINSGEKLEQSATELPQPITLVVNLDNPQSQAIAPSNSVAELSSSPAKLKSLSSASELLADQAKELKFFADKARDIKPVERAIAYSEKPASQFTDKTIPTIDLPNLQVDPNSKIQTAWTQLPDPVKTQPFLIAGPENLNPSLQLPPPPPPPPPKVENSTASTEPKTPFAVLERIETDFRNDQDNFGQKNQFIEPIGYFRLINGNRIRLKTGLDTFAQPGFNSVTNIPLQIGWEGKVGQFNVLAAGGVDLFDRLPTALNLDTKVETQIFRTVTLSGILQQGPYKFNAQTLNNQITAWRYGTNFYWQIDRNTSLFSLFRFGNYNDGNSEQQSFSRLERKFGQFSIAANLFNWSYQNDYEKRSGYFSPPDFLVYNAEVAWQGDIFKFLRCRISGNLGKQRLLGKVDNANNYQALCTVKMSPKIEADIGYSYSNLKNRDEPGGSIYNNRSITGQLRWNL